MRLPTWRCIHGGLMYRWLFTLVSFLWGAHDGSGPKSCWGGHSNQTLRLCRGWSGKLGERGHAGELAAFDRQCGTGRIARLVRAEPEDRACDLATLAAPLPRHRQARAALHLRSGAFEVLSDNGPGGDCVHANALVCVLERRRFRQPDHAVLCGDVAGEAAHAFDAG